MAALAKLTRPKLHKVVPRERVYREFDEARSRPLVWVTSPPGSGKTTAVASYLEARKVRSLWYQIDSGDRDVASFFYYLSLAAEAHSGKRKQPLPLLTPDYLLDIAAYARHYFRLFYGRLKAPAVLVLDNYHELPTDSVLHGLLEQAILDASDGINVVVISRTEPDPGCVRLEATDRLSRVGYEALRLTLAEARDIAALRCEVDDATLQILYAQSGGWVAGLTLTLERMKRLGSPEQAVSGEALESVFDYFAGQILKSTEPGLRDFLIRSALLPRMTATMAQQLTGNVNAGALLQDLYRQRLFTDRRGDEYQYHDLFRAFLLDQFEQGYSEVERNELRQHAGRLLEGASQVEAAVALYREAQDWTSTVRAIVARAESLIAQGRWKTLLEWIGSLPAPVAASEPWIDYWLGMSVIATDPLRARISLETAFEKFQKANQLFGELLSVAHIVYTYAFHGGEFASLDRWAQRLERLIESAPAFPLPIFQLGAHGALLFTQVHRRADPEAIERTAARVSQLLDANIPADNKMTAALVVLLFLFLAQHTDRALIFIQKIETQIEPAAVSPNNQMEWLALEGWFWTQCLDPDRARNCFERAQEIGRANAITYPFRSNINYYGLAWASLQRGDPKAAESYLGQSTSMLDSSRPMDVWMGLSAKSYAALQAGDLHGAISAARAAHDAAVATGARIYQSFTSVSLAVTLIELGQYDEADALLDSTREWLAGSPYEKRLAEIELVRAYSALRRGDRSACCDSLRQALGRTHQYQVGLGYLMAERKMLARLLAVALIEQIEVDCARRIIQLAKLSPPTPVQEQWPWPLKIRTLGPFQLLRNEVPVEFPHKSPKKPLQLLKALVAFGSCDVSVQKLMDALWADLAGDQARNALNIALNRLRKLLDDTDAIFLGDGVLSVDPTRLWVDVIAFQRLAEESLRADTTAGKAAARRAVEMYRAGFLEEEQDAPWAVSLRERARARFIRLVTDLAADLEHTDEYDAAIALYHRGIEADDLAEAFYRGLMRCYAAQDRRAEAMNVFRRLRQTLSVTLGIAPSAASQALFDSLRP